MTAVPADESEVVSELPTPSGPGARLQAARKAKNLSIERVAAQLHLTTDVVASLERDHFDGLPSRVFVRGYLRNYSRMLGLPEDSVLAAYDAVVPESEGQRKIRKAGSAKPIEPGARVNKGMVGLITWLIALAVLGLFATWWMGYVKLPDALQQLMDGGTGQQVEAPLAPVGDQPATSLPLQQPAAEPQPLAVISDDQPVQLSLPSADSEPQPVAEPVVEAAQPAAAPVTEQITPPAMPAPVAELAEAADNATPEPAAAVASTPEPVAATPPAPVGGVVLQFEQACWVDVRDASGEFRLVGVMQPGSTRVLGGEAPYRMNLGNAEGVRLLVDGQPYDLAPYTSKNVARLTLNP